jgi:hypothetical protein
MNKVKHMMQNMERNMISKTAIRVRNNLVSVCNNIVKGYDADILSDNDPSLFTSVGKT